MSVCKRCTQVVVNKKNHINDMLLEIIEHKR